MHIEWIDQFQDIPLSPEQWNNLVQKNDTNTVFQTYEWFESWWKVFGKKHQLVFLVAYDLGSVIGFVPLMLIDSSYGNKSLHFAGDTNADYCDFVIDGNQLKVISEFLKYIDTVVTDWTTMILLNIPSQSTTLACLQTICQEQDYNIAIKQRVKAPALIIEGRQQQALALVNKYSVTRHLRRINKHGGIKFINLNKKDQILAYMDLFFEQHIERYRLKNMVSQFVNKDNRQLYIDLVENLDHTGWLLFSVLLHKDKPIAFHFGFNYNNKIIWYKPTFSPSYRAYSPGTLMLKCLVEYAVEIQSSELDFTIGNESFKSRFSNCIRDNQNVVIYRSKALCVLLISLRRLSSKLYRIWCRILNK